MELYEQIPLDQLNLLNRMTVDTYLKYADKKKYKLKEVKEHFALIKKYIRNHIKCDGNMKKLYKHSERGKKGRLYGNDSIQAIDGVIRGFLFRNITTDLDMKNAHPVILKYLCKEHNIDCPKLTDYVNNRDIKLDELKQQGVIAPKMEILKLMNNDKPLRPKNDYLKDLSREFERIRCELVKEEDYAHLLKDAMDFKPTNMLGSFVNRLLCVYENDILQIMINHLNNNEYKICSLAFDGCLIYGNHYDNENLLEQLEADINNTFYGMNMKLSYKEHDTTITTEELNSLPEVSTLTYQDLKYNFEKQHIKIVNKSIFIKELDDKYLFFTESKLKESYKHLRYVDADKTDSFITTWLNDPNIRLKEDMDIYPPPLTCPSNMYNLWSGFEMDKINNYETKDISIILNHIKILCNNDECVYDYIIKWLAQMVQFPAQKTIIPTFISGEGAGKGSFTTILEMMFGESKYFETTQPERDVWGAFNNVMVNTFFIHISELSKKQTMECEGKIKGLITDKSLPINSKGKDVYTINSFHRFMVCTNNLEPVSTHEQDRRNIIIRSSDELIGDKDYFNTFRKEVYNTDMIKSFYEYLKSIPDMNDFHSIPKPITEYQEAMTESNMCPIDMFVRHITQTTDNEIIRYNSKELYNAFQDYISEFGVKYEINQNKLSSRLSLKNIKGIATKKSNGLKIKEFDISVLKNHYKL